MSLRTKWSNLTFISKQWTLSNERGVRLPQVLRAFAVTILFYIYIQFWDLSFALWVSYRMSERRTMWRGNQCTASILLFNNPDSSGVIEFSKLGRCHARILLECIVKHGFGVKTRLIDNFQDCFFYGGLYREKFFAFFDTVGIDEIKEVLVKTGV